VTGGREDVTRALADHRGSWDRAIVAGWIWHCSCNATGTGSDAHMARHGHERHLAGVLASLSDEQLAQADEAAVRAWYEANMWSGCNGSRWERHAADITLRDGLIQVLDRFMAHWLSHKVADALLPLLRAHDAQVEAAAWEAGVRQAITWLRADYPYGTGPDWRENGCDWIANRLSEQDTPDQANT
jgi:hypothetical protein